VAAETDLGAGSWSLEAGSSGGRAQCSGDQRV